MWPSRQAVPSPSCSSGSYSWELQLTDCIAISSRIDGVKGVFFGPDFIVITKHDDECEWKLMKPEIFATIMDFFTSGLPVVNADVETLTSTEIYDDDDDTVAMIKVLSGPENGFLKSLLRNCWTLGSVRLCKKTEETSSTWALTTVW